MKIKSGTRAEKLREAIEKILRPRVSTGSPRETELAQRFGVSRTPLREALIQLSSMGIVALRPRRGAVVAEVTPQRLLEMFEVMAELEAMCGRLAARRMSAEDLAVLIRAHKACEAASIAEDPDGYYHERKTHNTIY
jgi:DNA-binding GntR family transcriptional regulator